METKKIYETSSDIELMTARHLLDESGIPSFVINKKDTVYSGILGGKAELYVPVSKSDEAKSILLDNDILEE